MNKIEVVIIGGGIGGLATALALRRGGVTRVRVFERASEIKEVGAGLGVWANAVRVLDELGAGERIRAAALPMRTVGLYAADGRRLSVSDMVELERELGVPSFVMHRADLQRALLADVPAETITTGVECTGCAVQSDGRVQVSFRNHPPVVADLVIGADGFNSTIRRELWGETPVRYSGQTCYRGVVDRTVEHPGLLAEIQGRGKRLGYCPFAAGRMYWFACYNAPRNAPEDSRGAKAKLNELFSGWPLGLPAIIAATPDDAILRNDLCDRAPLRQWSRGRVTLLGDAAHPMLPNLGQGACTAIEDAAVLGRCVTSAPAGDVAGALTRYEAERIPRTTRLVQLSWRFGRFARWKNPLAVRTKEMLVRFAPAGLLKKELRWQLGYRAP